MGSRYFAETEILNAKQHEEWIYVWGRIEYHDGFVGGRFIEFCHRYNSGAADRRGVIDEITARFHGHGNRTDEG
jgi:hypothetical protein